MRISPQSLNLFAPNEQSNQSFMTLDEFNGSIQQLQLSQTFFTRQTSPSNVRSKRYTDSSICQNLLTELRSYQDLQNLNMISIIKKLQNSKAPFNITAKANLPLQPKLIDVGTRLNKFQAEDYFFIRNEILNEQNDKRMAQNPSQTIHLQIDKKSMKSLIETTPVVEEMIGRIRKCSQQNITKIKRGSPRHKQKCGSSREQKSGSREQSAETNTQQLQNLIGHAKFSPTNKLQLKIFSQDRLNQQQQKASGSFIVQRCSRPSSSSSKNDQYRILLEQSQTDSFNLLQNCQRLPVQLSKITDPFSNSQMKHILNQSTRQQNQNKTSLHVKNQQENCQLDEEDKNCVKIMNKESKQLPGDKQESEQILEIESLIESGIQKPGEKIELEMQLEILKQNAEFKKINFGQNINEESFESLKPLGIDRDANLTEYRKWKRVQVLLKRQQMEERIKVFSDNIRNFKSKRHDIQNDFSYTSRPKPKLETAKVVFIKSQSLKDKFLQVNKTVESKVRSLLEKTELKTESKTARIIVEILKEKNSTAIPLIIPSLVAKKLEPKRRI